MNAFQVKPLFVFPCRKTILVPKRTAWMTQTAHCISSAIQTVKELSSLSSKLVIYVHTITCQLLYIYIKFAFIYFNIYYHSSSINWGTKPVTNFCHIIYQNNWLVVVVCIYFRRRLAFTVGHFKTKEGSNSIQIASFPTEKVTPLYLKNFRWNKILQNIIYWYYKNIQEWGNN